MGRITSPIPAGNRRGPSPARWWASRGPELLVPSRSCSTSGCSAPGCSRWRTRTTSRCTARWSDALPGLLPRPVCPSTTGTRTSRPARRSSCSTRAPRRSSPARSASSSARRRPFSAWTLYLLARALADLRLRHGRALLGWGRWESGIAALIAPLLFSVTGHGFEHQAYAWLGSGLWSELWAMWSLPLAWVSAGGT